MYTCYHNLTNFLLHCLWQQRKRRDNPYQFGSSNFSVFLKHQKVTSYWFSDTDVTFDLHEITAIHLLRAQPMSEDPATSSQDIFLNVFVLDDLKWNFTSKKNKGDNLITMDYPHTNFEAWAPSFPFMSLSCLHAKVSHTCTHTTSLFHRHFVFSKESKGIFHWNKKVGVISSVWIKLYFTCTFCTGEMNF